MRKLAIYESLRSWYEDYSALDDLAESLEVLKQQNVEWERHDLEKEPEAFEQNAAVAQYMKVFGEDRLPLTLVDGVPVIAGHYPEDAELIVLENIGNLVCPAEFDTGAAINMTILSVPEGDDKPAKYPLMYETCDMLVVNKIDTLPIFDFDKEKMEGYARARNPEIEIFYISAKTGEGVQELADALVRKVKEWNAK